MPTLKILPGEITLQLASQENLMAALQKAGVYLDAPCGGKGKCGKCKVMVDGKEVLSCQTIVDRDMTVTIPDRERLNVLHNGIDTQRKINPLKKGFLLAFDIGTTSVVCFLLDGKTGEELASASMLNPQTAFGADVISRIQAALAGSLEREAQVIREGMTELIRKVCMEAQITPEEIGVVSVVGNPAMQQLFLGISPENLAGVPFAPVLTSVKTVPCAAYLPICTNAELLILPDISGYIGADTLGCVLSTKLYEAEDITLMVDIGTNGEMVLGNRDRMIACSTAAGPALEGANIRFGMRGMNGAIDHVRMENGKMQCSIIGGGTAKGICGSGLIDAVAALLDAGLLNKRGRIQGTDEVDGERVVYLTHEIYLSQDDIRQVQLAKGAIHAGISLMAKQLGIGLGEIKHVLLAGAFGSYLNPASACRIGLLPKELEGKITAVGNAAGSGAKMLACDWELLKVSQALTEKIEFLELASLPEFSRTFARSMNFQEAE